MKFTQKTLIQISRFYFRAKEEAKQLLEMMERQEKERVENERVAEEARKEVRI